MVQAEVLEQDHIDELLVSAKAERQGTTQLPTKISGCLNRALTDPCPDASGEGMCPVRLIT